MVARYVANVPLTNISAIHRRACCAKDLEDLVHESQESAAATRRKLANMKDMFQAAFLRRSGLPPHPRRVDLTCPLRSYSSAEVVGCTSSPTGRSPPSRCSSGARHAIGSSVYPIIPFPRWLVRSPVCFNGHDVDDSESSSG